MPGLFDTLSLRGLTLRNRIGIAPMCQYSSVDGIATDWHLVHLGARAAGGAGLIITEATAVEPRGRISPFDLGLWDDAQIAPLRRVTDFIRSQGAASAVQLAHAGRKASRTAPWGADGKSRERGLTPAEGAWPLCGPSAIAMEADSPAPDPLDAAGIQRVLDAFAAAAVRAGKAGFDVIEVHAAHGYLANSFASPISNRRDDAFGGSFEHRARFMLEIAAAIRTVWPDSKPLLFRISATDWIDAGWTIDDSVRLAPLLQRRGVDLIDCSSGGVAAAAIPVEQGYQVPLADAVRNRGGVPSAAVGLIGTPEQAEQIIRKGQADLVLLGRAALRDPNWPLRAAIELGVAPSARLPIQYSAAWRKSGFGHTPLGVPIIE